MGSGDQTVPKGKAHIADFNFLNNILGEARVLHFQVVFKIKRIVIVKISGDFKFFSDFSHDVHTDLLIEFKPSVFLLVNGYGGILDPLPATPEIEGHKSVRPDIDITSAKDPVEFGAEIYGRDQPPAADGALPVQASRFFFPVISEHLLIIEPVVLFESVFRRRPENQVTHIFLYGIIQGRVDMDFSLEQGRILKEKRGARAGVQETVPIPVAGLKSGPPARLVGKFDSVSPDGIRFDRILRDGLIKEFGCGFRKARQ